MYQVVKMYGDSEPWWFFEDWEADMQSEQSFATFRQAETFYYRQWELFHAAFSCLQAKENYLAAFWNEEDKRWCEECGTDLQQYQGLALLKDHLPISEKSERKYYEATNSSGKTKRCQRSERSIRCQ